MGRYTQNNLGGMTHQTLQEETQQNKKQGLPHVHKHTDEHGLGWVSGTKLATYNKSAKLPSNRST